MDAFRTALALKPDAGKPELKDGDSDWMQPETLTTPLPVPSEVERLRETVNSVADLLRAASGAWEREYRASLAAWSQRLRTALATGSGEEGIRFPHTDEQVDDSLSALGDDLEPIDPESGREGARLTKDDAEPPPGEGLGDALIHESRTREEE